MSKTVSVITITQLSRFPCIEILKDMIEGQTHPVNQWVIVEGSKTAADAEANAAKIKSLQSAVPIQYIEYEEGIALGGLRNKGNQACTGDITVVMDDDDYYPPERVAHAVEKLSASKISLAGCSAAYMYDYTLKRLYKNVELGPTHSTNNCMAWKRKYLEKHKHDPTKTFAEESSFTNGFKEQMIQLSSDKTIVVSAHSSNTYNKRENILKATHKMTPQIKMLDISPITHIKEPFFKRLESVLSVAFDSPYDIVYMTGAFSIQWDPRSESLGGSEQAVVHLTSEWARLGKKVAVYGEVPELTHNGVDYIAWNKFPHQAKYKTVILWRLYGFMTAAPFPIKADRIWWDLHDNLSGGIFPDMWNLYGSVPHKVFFKSQYHQKEFEKTTRQLCDRAVIIPNGIRINLFTQTAAAAPAAAAVPIQRNPYRFCYCSCYTRGLEDILEHLWPTLWRIEPRAELHVYYGMDGVKDNDFKKRIMTLLAQPGVMDHGRQPAHIVAREKHMSAFHLYITDTTAEIDCISVRESMVAGAIPLLADFGVFKEREGYHFDVKGPKTYPQCAISILNLMKDEKALEEYRMDLKKARSVIGWPDIAKAWIQDI